jgi:hypothetical protein
MVLKRNGHIKLNAKPQQSLYKILGFDLLRIGNHDYFNLGGKAIL